MHTFYVVDLANQITKCTFATLAEYEASWDRWEADGHDVFDDKMAAMLNRDRYHRMMYPQPK